MDWMLAIDDMEIRRKNAEHKREQEKARQAQERQRRR